MVGSEANVGVAESREGLIGPQSPFLIAGIGASAGGLEAFSRVLRSIPEGTPVALILVQHLARAQPSLLPEILAGKTWLRVEDAVDGKPIDSGYVYVIRPDTSMAVIDGHLCVRPRPLGHNHDTPINHLFDSMAEHYQEKALGVVLSGSGSDGATGIQRIHAAGGITIAQEPTDAQFDSMPRSAIATGSVSTVLPADKIATEIARLAAHPFYHETGRVESPLADSETVLEQILHHLRRMTGVDFTRYKTPTIRRRIQRRMAVHRLTELDAYLDFFVATPIEAKQLRDDILIHVTGFFRERESFEALKNTILPEIIKMNRGDGPIRVWVPGCSSGEEVYSLAITMLEVIDQLSERVSVVVFGTDLSESMIEIARSATYPESIMSDVSPEQLRRHFVKCDAGYRVATHVRERCVFARQDVTRDPPFSKLDIVMCRNLLIYLAPQAQRKLVGMFHYALLPHGVLVLGKSETVGPMPQLFHSVDSRWKIYQRTGTGAPTTPVQYGPNHSELSVTPTRFPATPAAGRPKSDRDVNTEANRILLDRYAPPLLIVDEALRIIRSQGKTSPFLELPSGEATLDVLRMVRPGLMSPLRAALEEVQANGGTVRKENLLFRSDEVMLSTNLEVTKLGAVEPRVMIIFEQPATVAGTAAPKSVVKQDVAIEQLQRELNDVRADLQTMIQELEGTNEDLQSANEEILSSNEELQSTNEELDTAREELQSTNEELETVNDELQTRNVELGRTNADLVNLLASVDIAIVMVAPDLRIRLFTPAAERALNLIASDVGRPIGHIKPNFSFPDLEATIRNVLETAVIAERQIEDSEGHTYTATVRPYRSHNSSVDGAVLAFFDVSAPLEVARQTGEAVISSVREPILLLESNMTVRRANQAFYEKFGINSTKIEGRSVFDVGESQWNVPELRRLLEEVLPQRHNFENFELDYRMGTDEASKLSVDARRIESGRGSDGVVLLIIRDAPRA